MDPKHWMSPKVAGTAVTLSLMAQVLAQAQQLSSLPADDPSGPLPMQVSSMAPLASGATQVVVQNTVAGADFVADFPPQFHIVVGGSKV
jgi:hypothetical protein